MIRYLLDTCACTDVIRGRGARVLERLETCVVGEVAISTITLAELQHGVEKSSKPERNRIALLEFVAPLEIVPFDDAAAIAYGAVRTELERAGTPIGPLDTLIAAQARAADLTLVTTNEAEFRRVPGLALESWS